MDNPDSAKYREADRRVRSDATGMAELRHPKTQAADRQVQSDVMDNPDSAKCQAVDHRAQSDVPDNLGSAKCQAVDHRVQLDVMDTVRPAWVRRRRRYRYSR